MKFNGNSVVIGKPLDTFFYKIHNRVFFGYRKYILQAFGNKGSDMNYHKNLVSRLNKQLDDAYN